MNIKEARAAIEAILAAIPDDQLPKFDKIETDEKGRICAWWGSTGHFLGSSTSNGVRDPLGYRRSGAWGAIEAEMTCRADQRLLANGDDPKGILLPAKRRKVA